MFAHIARRYDLLNRLMTLGRDRAWRREVVRRAGAASGARLLDLGAGTGDLAREALRRQPQATVVAADFTPAMMAVGRRRPAASLARWVAADALHLPFAAGVFDVVVSGFLLRNLVDLDAGLREQARVLRPGGRALALDTTPPGPGPLRPLIRFHLRHVIPLLGRLVAGDAEAYNYLPETSERFLSVEALAARLRAAGFERVGAVRRMFGTVAIHWGSKPGPESAL